MLYIVSTPIGNFGDITNRAIDVLKKSHYVLAEDTRRTGKLFFHYGIKNRLVSFNDFNKKRKLSQILSDLKAGEEISLVSDAGTPGISDPGFFLVREAIKNEIKVSPVPGPSSVISALICSGLPTDRFTFYGFFPKKTSKQKDLLKLILKRKETAILFESPHRIEKTMALLLEEDPGLQLVIARELTKKFEEFIRGTAAEVSEKISNRKLKGELVIIIKAGKAPRH